MPYSEVPWMWSDQYGVNLQVAGVPDISAELIIRGDGASESFIGFTLVGKKIMGAIAINQARDMRLIRRIMDAGKMYSKDDLKDTSISMRELSKR